MIFIETELPGAFVIEPEPIPDERGFFARAFCRRELEDRGLASDYVQSSISFNHRDGTLRGMHYQAAPHAEDKLVRCTAGRVYDVIVDLRPDSPTRGKWTAVKLTAANRRALYVPRGFAHGFQTLADASEVHYAMTAFHTPSAARGFRYDDPAFGIAWPRPPSAISERDRSWPDFDPEAPGA